MKTLLISDSEIEKLISIGETIETVEDAFTAKGLGKVQMPPKSYIYFEEFNGDFRVMPAYLEETGAAGVKIVNSHPDNPESKGLPTVMAIVVLLNPENGKITAIMDGTEITSLRTGAAGAIAAKHLARSESNIVGMIGTGTQAKTQLKALSEIFDLKEVSAYSDRRDEKEEFARSMNSEFRAGVKPVESVKEAVQDADVIVSTTPVRSPIISDEWIPEGAHINAIGADAKGKQELDPRILKRAKIVVDDWEQASHSGEINVPLSKGEISKRDIYADIGEIVTGKKEGRTSGDEITVFDSTGLAVQDIGTAWRAYRKALKIDAGNEVEIN